MRTRRIAAVSALTVLTAASLASAAGKLIAMDSARRVYEMNQVTGDWTLLATSNVIAGSGTSAGLAYDYAGDRLFLTATGANSLLRLDRTTWQSTLVGSYAVSGIVMHGIEWDSSTNTLYGGSNGTLYTINPATGAASAVGASGTTSFLNLGFDSRANILYGTSSNTDSFYTLDRTSGAATLIGALGEPTNPHAMAYSKDNGALYLLDTNVDGFYLMDVATGVAHRIGDNPGTNVLGLVYIPDNCSEPTVPGGAGYATPYNSPAGGSQLLTVKTLGVLSPPSTGITVTGDFSALGGSATQAFASGGGGQFTFNLNIPVSQAPGTYVVPLTISDAEARTGTSGIAVRVRPGAAQGFVTEIEPNEDRTTATAATLTNGQGVSGRSIGSSVTVPGDASADIFKITTAPAPTGVYRHRFIPESPILTHTFTIRGLSQTGGVISTTDATFATSSGTSVPQDFVQWYGFGKGESVYVRVAGTAASTYDYDIALETTPVTPTQATTNFTPGNITIARTSGTTANDFVVYTAAGEPVADFVHQGSTATSSATRSLAAGNYILAISSVNTADNRATPGDSPTLTGAVLDFPYAIANSSTTLTTVLPFSISDGVNTENFSFAHDEVFEVMFVRFTVGTPVSSVVCCRGTTCTLVATAGECTVPASPNVGAATSPATACGVDNNATTGCCFADFNKDSSRTIDDIFIYLNAWFGSSPFTDIGGDGVTSANIDDIFVFLNLWFQGC